MQTYTTPPMTGRQCDDFISWFDSAIGTETETHQDGDAFTVTCHELETGEPAQCKRMAMKLIKTNLTPPASGPLRLAYFNGQKTTAKKCGYHWLVGGDFPQKSDKVQIAALHKDWFNGGHRWAWHTLKGCYLKFDDFMTTEEIAENAALNCGGQNNG